MDKCPPVARVIPLVKEEFFPIAQKTSYGARMMRNGPDAYRKWVRSCVEKDTDLLEPAVPYTVSDRSSNEWFSRGIERVACDEFMISLREIIFRAMPYSEQNISRNYIYLMIREIGMDCANDVSWIEHCIETPGFERSKVLVAGKRMKFEYAVAVAAAYCIRVGATSVYYEKDETFKWK